MNRNYKVIWNASLSCFMAVSEYAKARGKSSKSSVSANATINTTSNASSINRLRLSAIGIGLIAAGFTMSPQVFAATGVGGGVDIGTASNCSTAASAGKTDSVAVGCDSVADLSSDPDINFYDRGNPDNQSPIVDTGTNFNSTAIGNGAIAKEAGTSLGMNASSRNLGVALGIQAKSENVAALAIGPAALAKGNTSLALGRQSAATADFAQAIGNVASATGKGSLAVGHSARAEGYRSIAIGSADIDGASATGTQSGVVYQTNQQTLSKGLDSIAIGSGAIADATFGSNASGTASTAIGKRAKAQGPNTLALGANSDAKNGTAVGSGAIARNGGLAVGMHADAGPGSSFLPTSNVALGDNSKVTGGGFNVALGAMAVAGDSDLSMQAYRPVVGVAVAGENAVGEVSIGGDDGFGTVYRRLTNLAAGAADTDGVNVSQLKSGLASIASAATHFYSVNSTDTAAGNYNNEGATGTNSMAAGINAEAESKGGLAMGFGAKATGPGGAVDSAANNIAIGTGSTSSATQAIAIGHRAASSDFSSVAIGTDSVASKKGASALGHEAAAIGDQSIAIGRLAAASATDTIALGYKSKATVKNAVAIGDEAEATKQDAWALGRSAKADGNFSMAMGQGSLASENNGIAMGATAKSQAEKGIAIGALATVGTRGEKAIAIGDRSLASAKEGVAIGPSAVVAVSAPGGVAIGSGARVIFKEQTSVGELAGAFSTGSQSNTLIGYFAGHTMGGKENTATGTKAGASSKGDQNTFMGYLSGNKIEGSRNVAIGNSSGNAASGDQNVFIGNNAGKGSVTSNKNIAIGLNAGTNLAGVESSIAIGDGTIAHSNSIAIGTGNQVTGDNSGAFGDPNIVSGTGSYAVGNNNNIANNNNFVLGNNVGTTQDNSVVLGNLSTDRAATTETGIMINGTTYTYAGQGYAAKGVVSVGSIGGERQIINVAAGNVSATSTDAINGSQLHATNESINDLSTTVVANKTHYYSVKDGGTPKANYNNNGAIGNNAMAAGIGAEAKGDQATAVGYKAKAVASESTAIGREALAEGHRSVALGYAAKAKGPQSVAIGDNAETQARSAIAIGLGAKAFNGSSIAIGEGADTNTATDAIAFGTGANVKNRHGIALGIGATSVGDGALALGSGANANNLYTIAIGRNAQALHRESVAIGKGAIAKDGKAVSIGSENIASGDGAVAIGDPNVAIGAGAVAIGKDNTATGIGAIALGNESIATKDSNIALGDKAQASGNQSIAQGSHAMATGSQSIAQGTYAKATGNYSLAQGYFSEATRSGAIAYGRDAKAFGENAIAQGVKAKASGASSVAIGDGSEARGEDSIAMGRGAIAGQSDNVALGSNSITGAQHIGSFSINNLPVSGLINGAKTVSVGTVGAERQIQNVAPGVVDATSTDAINGSQLFVTNKAIGELGSTVGDGLNFVGDRDGVINRQFGDTLSIKGGAASTATLTNNNIGIRRDGSNGLIVELADKVNLGTNGSVNIGNTQVKNTGIIIAGSTLSNTVVLNNNGLNNGGFKVVNIDKGNVSATSADAINGSQLFGTAKSIANNFGGGSIVNPDGTVSTPVYQVNGNDQTGVAGAIAELDKGFNLETNGADPSTVKAGDTIDIGTANGETNIKVAKTGNDIKFKLADNIDLISVKTGNSFLDSNGLTIINGPSFTTTGINAGNQQITRVSSGGVLTDANNDLNAANIGDVKGAIGNVTTLGFGIKAADGNTVMKPLGQAVEIVGSNSNIDTQVDNITGKVEVKLSNNLDLGPTGTVKAGSIIGGGTVISPLGVTVTGPIGFNNASVTKDGLIISGGPQVIRTGINAGNKKVINVDKGVITATSTDAINGSQLFSTAESIASNFGGDSVVNSDGTVSTPSYVLDDGTNTGTKAPAFTNVGGALGNLDGRTTINSTNIAKGLSFNLNGNARNYQLGDIIRVDTDANIVTTANGNGAKFSLAPVINLGTTNPVQINGETGTISGLSNTTFDPDEIYEGGQAATQEQLFGLQSGISYTFDKGILFGGDNAPTTIKRKLGDTIIVKGGVSDSTKLTDSNIGVIADNNANTLTVKLATDLTGLNSASFGNDIMISSDGLKAGTTVVNTSGVSFSGSAVGLNSSGLNNGGNKITNVASGDVSSTSTDAVNGSQLFNINKDIINKGIKIGDGNSANDQQFALGSTINVTGDSNITTTASATGVQVKLNNQLNLGDDGRMQMGNSIMNNTGFTFVGNEPGRTVILGAGGLNNGFNRITNVAAGLDPTDAATVGQLSAATFALDRGWALSAQGDEATMVKQGSAFDLNSRDGNIKISRTAVASSVGRASRAVDPNDMTFDLNRDIAIDSVQTGDTTINNEGLTIVGGPSVTKAGINAADTKVTNVVNGEVAANSKDAINGGQLYAQGAGISSIIGGNTTYDPVTGTFTNSNIGGTGQASIDGAIASIKRGEAVMTESIQTNTTNITTNTSNITRNTANIATNTANISTNTTNIKANTDKIDAGLNFGADSGAVINKPIGDGSVMSFKGGNNIKTTAEGSSIKFDLNGNINVESVTTGNTTVNNSGVTIKNGPSMTAAGIYAGNTETAPSMTAAGINAAGTKVTNVADGMAPRDAVNYGQLEAVTRGLGGSINELGYKIGEVEDDANAGISAAMAMSSLPQAYIIGKPMIGGGIATFNGESAVAIGFSKMSNDGRWVMKLNGTADTQGNVGGAIGAGFHFD